MPARALCPLSDAGAEPLVDESGASEYDEVATCSLGAGRDEKMGRRVRKSGALVVTGLIGVVLVGLTLVRPTDPSVRRSDSGVIVGLAEDAKGDEQPKEDEPHVKILPDSNCSLPGEDCSKTKCCRAGGTKGMQCYLKDEFWGTCSESCQPGVHEGEKHGTWNQYGKFELDKWSCKEVGERSKPGCVSFTAEDECPTDRCMWKGECLDACDTFAAEGSCTKAAECMWQVDRCMEACSSFDSQETCKPTDKCVWYRDQCLNGWWTYYSRESCPHENGYIWKDSCIKDPCSAPGEDCRDTKCCSKDRGGGGMTCFSKNKEWASCQEICTDKEWDCDALGNRTGYPLGCDWAGTDCSATHLCCNRGFVCAKKDKFFTGCVQTVQKTTWMTKNIPIPSNWEGTVVGGGRDEYQVQPAPEDKNVWGNSLYCFIAFLPDSPEVALVDLARKNKASIFGCDAHDLFHSWQSGKAGWDTGEATLVNTDVFIKVWDQVREKGTYSSYDWTVKVDADCVMVPDRMRSHIAALRVPDGVPAYVKNNGMDPGLGNNGFLGAVEAFNKKAVMLYFDNAASCTKYFGVNCGEDGFFKGCMDAMGVGFALDVEMFFPDHGAGACRQGQRAAFHPLKSPEKWQHCWDIVTGKREW